MIKKIINILSKLKPEKQLPYTIFKPRYKLFITHLIILIILFVFLIIILTWFFEKPTTVVGLWNALTNSFDQIISTLSLYITVGLFFALPVASIVLYFHKFIASLNSLNYDQKIIRNLIPSCAITIPLYLGIFTLYFSVFTGGYDVALSIIFGWVTLLFVRNSHYFYPDLEKSIGEGIGYVIVPFGIVLLIIPLVKILENPTPFLEQIPLIVIFFALLSLITIAIEIFLLYLLTENLKNVKIKKIINYRTIIERYNSTNNNDQKEDIKAEIEVGLHHVKKNHIIEYEPQKRTPDFKINLDNLEFYTEVKRVNETDEFILRKKAIIEFEKRLKNKLKSNYNLIFHLEYDQQLFTNIRNVVEFIINIDSTINLSENEQCRDLEVILNGRNYGSIIIYKPGKKTKRQKILYDEPIWSDMASRIRNQIIKANLKEIPENRPYFVIVKLPTFVDKETAKEALFGSEIIRLYWKVGQLNPNYFIEKNIVNKIFNHPEHYKKISAIIYYYDEFKSKNAMYEINQNANFKISMQDIKEFYFDAKLLQ